MDPLVPVTLYAGTESGRVFWTIDGGENWKRMPAFSDKRIGTIVVAADGRTIYVSRGYLGDVAAFAALSLAAFETGRLPASRAPASRP